ncbi:hypothetical protein [Streptomyces albus]|uniref:hypothetical protein n=1 Tax=Streptomyces albus TaxID=1888 RepID=UPI000B1804A8|nr:hypothetical protein [Streptomyces albus]
MAATTPVRYIRVKPLVNLFAPAVRAYGNIAIVGTVTQPSAEQSEKQQQAEQAEASETPQVIIEPNKATLFTDVSQARAEAPGNLGDAVALALVQEPGPSAVWGVRLDANQDLDKAFAVVATLDVQFVVLANTPLTGGATPTPAIVKLAEYVASPALDGMERMGVAMLGKGDYDPTVVAGKLSTERMIYVAHKSAEDVAAAVAGTVAGYEPHVSMLLKKVKVTSDPFTAQELLTLNGTETPDGGPAGKNVNWLVNPPLIPGEGIYLGEGYTGASGPEDKKYIDIVRTVDDITFRLKAQLIQTIGSLRISRSGLRALVAETEAVLEPLRRREVIEGYETVVPALVLLDKPQLSTTEQKLLDTIKRERAVEVMVKVVYAGAIHRLNITLRFE